MIKLNSILEIIDNYDNFILDQWGVMHNGYNGYKHAIDAIQYLEKKNKKLFIISNSSKRKKSSEDRLTKLGFYKNSFINVLTSGEMIWDTIHKKYLNSSSIKKCFHIYNTTKEDGLYFREGLNLKFTEKIEESDLILACTPFSNMTPLDYVPLLNKAIQNKLKMYCANPDFETIEKNNDKNIFCMGAIAEIYKKMGGEVIIKGKPDISIYNKSTESIEIDKMRTIAIGDSLFHDIKGANNFDIDSILVKSGIHKDLNTINKLIQNHEIKPSFLIDNFSI
ncbi:TIGR01459 family HAD-type hydrolase [Pelagibacteraceae bacterium]|nr:TIGR01459 family HAD-type hydrolase [Pelagibacteraceae bacterium]